MRPALTAALIFLMPLTASCGLLQRGAAVLNPPKPLPAWVASDFDCGGEPTLPPQHTTKAIGEGYLTDSKAHERTCQTMLNARGDDARRYGLLGDAKK